MGRESCHWSLRAELQYRGARKYWVDQIGGGMRFICLVVEDGKVSKI